MARQSGEKNNTKSLTVGRIFLRFLIWLFVTITIIIAGIFFYFLITFKGPSKIAADNMAVKLQESEYLSFIPDLFSYKQSADNTTGDL